MLMTSMTSQDKLKYCYITLALCIITSTIPQTTAQFLSMIISIVALPAFYVLRNKWHKQTFEYKEGNALIRTFWIWSVLYLVGLMVAGGLISSFSDMTAMNAWTESIVQGTAIPDEQAMEQVTHQFIEKNFWLITSMTILGILPAQIYAALRIKRGWERVTNLPQTEPDSIIG